MCIYLLRGRASVGLWSLHLGIEVVVTVILQLALFIFWVNDS